MSAADQLNVVSILFGLIRGGIDVAAKIREVSGRDPAGMSDAEFLAALNSISIRQPAELIAEGQRQADPLGLAREDDGA